jgi:protein PhnA
MSQDPKCPKCGKENTYFDSSIEMYVCPDCSLEFKTNVSDEEIVDLTPRDSNGSELMDGDSVTLIKDLKVRGSSQVLKRGTKVKSIRLTDDPEEVDCKIEGTAMVLKTCYLKKG